MVILYYGSSSKTCRQAISWFADLEIEVTKKRIELITRDDLIHMLSLSENGFSDLLKRSTGNRIHVNEVKQHINHTKFNEAINYLLKHHNVIKVPVIFDEHKLLIGYNTEEIRAFIPKDYREEKRRLKSLN